MPALASALRQAGVGPVSMMVGSLPITAAARMRARGFSPAMAPPSFEPTSISAAPSTMPDELPAWCMCSMRSTVVYLRSAVASKPIAPMAAKLGSSRDIASGVALSRIVSSRSSSSRPAISCTGTRLFEKCPAARAAAAFRCECRAKASMSARCQPSSVAIRSAPTPCGTKPSFWLMRGSMNQAPPSLPMGQRLMLSTPPPTTRSSKPLATLAAARFTDSSPLAQKRLCVTPATVSAHSASSTAVRAISAPCSPTGVTQPSTTSSTSEVSSALRCCSACSKVLTSHTGLAWYRRPSFLPLPRGVRTWS